MFSCLDVVGVAVGCNARTPLVTVWVVVGEERWVLEGALECETWAAKLMRGEYEVTM